MRLANGRASGSPNPPASSAGVSPRGSSISASGFPPASPRIRARTRSSSGPGIVASRSDRASSAGSPPTTSSGNPSSTRPSPDSRSPNTSPTRSANRRRATNASVCADTRSSHCASSTMHRSGCSSAASASRLRTANPTRKRSGGGPSLQAERRAHRIALRARQALEPAEHRRAQRVEAGERELHLGLDARGPGDPAPLRGTRQVPEQRGLADPGLAAEDQHPTLARAHSGHESFEHVALAYTVDQPRWVSVEHSRPIIAGRAPGLAEVLIPISGAS